MSRGDEVVLVEVNEGGWLADASLAWSARELADREGAPNVRFEVGDAQAHSFPSEAFHVAISRFGTMFFSDPDMAFRNIARAVRAGGRLVMMVWRATTGTSGLSLSIKPAAWESSESRQRRDRIPSPSLSLRRSDGSSQPQA